MKANDIVIPAKAGIQGLPDVVSPPGPTARRVALDPRFREDDKVLGLVSPHN